MGTEDYVEKLKGLKDRTDLEVYLSCGRWYYWVMLPIDKVWSFEIDDVNTRDNMQETLSLSDRFGLTVCYTVPKKSEFLEIVAAMAKEKGINISEAELFAGAERFALVKGGRSPRCAKQYVESLYT